MFHPRRVLQDLVDGELSDRRRIAVERHVARCESCSEAMVHLRELKSTLLGLRIPAAGSDFRSRLLAADFDPGSHDVLRAGHHGDTHVVPSPVRPRSRPPGGSHRESHPLVTDARRRGRTFAVAAGGTALVASALLAGAYAVGSQSRPDAVEAASGSLALRAGWESVVPQTPTLLDTEQLETLRAGGWYCPELHSLGFTLASAEGITVAGRPTLQLVLENDGETVTVFEQRKVNDVQEAGETPISALTGESVKTAGFDHMGGTDRAVWVRSGQPWQVVLDSPSVTYTVVSTLPAAAMPGTLSQLIATEHAQLSLEPRTRDDSTMERIVRGLSLITHPEEPAR